MTKSHWWFWGIFSYYEINFQYFSSSCINQTLFYIKEKEKKILNELKRRNSISTLTIHLFSVFYLAYKLIFFHSLTWFRWCKVEVNNILTLTIRESRETGEKLMPFGFVYFDAKGKWLSWWSTYMYIGVSIYAFQSSQYTHQL